MNEKDLEDLSAQAQLDLLESGDLNDAQVIRLIHLLESQGTERKESAALLAKHGLGLVERARKVAIDKAQTDTPLNANTRTVQADADSVTFTEDFPTRIGRFEIEREIGRGGFGFVLLAKDPQLQRFVALKIPKVEALLSGEGRHRFEREAQAAAILSHPAIIPIYESGHVGPITYIAFAFCDGPTLAKWFSDQNRQISAVLAARIVHRLAEAVQHAHSRGVIHRDLKPANVLLEDTSSEETGSEPFGAQRPPNGSVGSAPRPFSLLPFSLRIADFGLARIAGSDGEPLTRTGALIGTPAYMSPEQARGEPEIGEASDLYSLGAILYYLLSGKPPIKRESDLATLKAVETEMPRPLRSDIPSISRDLEAICLKCLEKKPRDRYRSAQDLEDDLQRFLSGRPVEARPVNQLTRVVRWCRYNPTVATVTALFLFSLIVGITTSTVFWQSAKNKAEEALLQTRMARVAVDDLLRAIAEESTLKSKGMESFRQKLLVSASNYYHLVSMEQPGDRQILREYIDTLKGLAYLNGQLGDHTTAEEIWNRAAELLETEFPAEIEAAAAMRSAQAENYNTLGRHQEAAATAAIAVDQLKRAVQTDSSGSLQKHLIEAMIQLARTLNANGMINDAEQVIDEAIERVGRLTGLPPEQWPAESIWGNVLRSKTEIVLSLLKHDDLDRFAPMTIRIFDQLMQDHPQRTAECLEQIAKMEGLLGTSLTRRQSLDNALDHLRTEGELLDQLLRQRPEVASVHSLSANQRFRLARCLYDSGNVQEAQEAVLAFLPQSQARVERFPDLNALRVTNVLFQQLLAKTYRKQNDLVAATEELAKAIALCETICQSPQASINSQMILSTLYMEQSTFYLQQRNLEDAASQCEQGLQILGDLYRTEPAGEHVGQLAFAYMLYGNIMNKLGQYEEFLQATDQLDDWPQPSPNIHKAKAHRVYAQIHVGRWAEARRNYERLSVLATDRSSCLDMAGLASRCAEVIAQAESTNEEDYRFFLTRGLGFLKKGRDLEMLQEESIVKLLQEHSDFAELRQTESFSDIVR